MRSLFIFGLLFITFIASSQASLTTVKSYDGKIAYCQKKFDVFRARNGVYRGKALNLKVTPDAVTLDISLNFLACVENAGKFGFVSIAPYEEVEFETISMSNESHLVQVITSEAFLKVYNESEYSILISKKITNETKQTISISIPLENVVTSEQLAKMNKGKAVKGSFDFWVAKKLTYKSLHKPYNMSFMKNLGSYRVFFEASLEADEFVVKLFE